MDHWKILPDEQVRYDQQFAQLNPSNGYLSGQQSRDFFFMSNLPPVVLAKIWELSDFNRDGKLDKREFSVAMHLIRKKIQGLELPATLPPTMLAGPASTGSSSAVWGSLPDLLPRPTASPPSMLGSMPGNTGVSGGGANDLQMSQFAQAPQTFGGHSFSHTMPLPHAHGADQRSRTGSGHAPHLERKSSLTHGTVLTGEWAVPHAAKLKFNKMFHDLDKTHSGFLNGNQARSILMQSGLPNPILAQIWGLADIDKDGRLTSEEFVLSMHLTEMARQREPIPAMLPSELIPPSFRRPRGLSANIPIPFSGGAASAPDNGLASSGSQPQEVFDMMPVSFEDKRKENFDKGNAELERRRQAIHEMQRQEREEREKREREEFERRERLRLEQERKRQLELESQLARQREIEERQEEERRKVIEQREAARMEMERQRKIERQKKKRHDLFNERTRAYEDLAHYKSQSSGIDLHGVDSDSKRADMMQLVEETRNQVRERKEVIDGMRTKRDQLLEEITRATNEETSLTDQTSRAKSERAMLEGRMSISSSGVSGESSQSLASELQRKQDTAAELQNKVSEVETTGQGLKKAIEDRNNRIKAFGDQFQAIYENHVRLLHDFRTKQTQFAQSDQRRGSIPDTPKSAGLYPSLHDMHDTAATSGSYGFSHDQFDQAHQSAADGWADNNFEAPDDVWGEQSPFGETGHVQNGSPSKVSELRDQMEKKLVVRTPSIKHDHHLSFDNDFKQAKFLRYRALYPYTAGNEDELSFQAGDIISVATAHDGEPGWLPGELGGKTGWLPENHVQLLVDAPDTQKEKPVPKVRGLSIQSDTPSLDNSEVLSGNVRAKAIHPWHAKKDTHLTFAKGDTLYLKKQAENWYFGEKDGGQSGWFPAQCIQIVTDGGAQAAVIGGLKKTLASHSSVDSHGGSGMDHESLHIAAFDFASDVEGDLTFHAGELIRVIQKDGDWWKGSVGSRTGVFPSSYVKEYSHSPQVPSSAALGRAMSQTSTDDVTKKKPEIVMAVASYAAGGAGQISFAKGDMILVKKKTDSGWWEGELQAKGKQRQTGWFPADYVKSMGGGVSSGTATPVDRPRGGSVSSHSDEPAGLKVLAMYDYNALNPDELSFKKNDTIIIVSKEDENWWKGILSGKQGILPSNYVQIIN